MKPLAALLLLCPALAAAQSVQLAGQMGRKALLVIDGQTVTLAVGETRQGVTLRSLDGQRAQVEWGGRVSTLSVGGAPVSVGAGAGGVGGRSIVLPVGPGGHFVTTGRINGRTVQFMVDTGATVIGLGAHEARAIGLDYQSGRRVTMNTANGPAPGWLVTLSTVSVGEVTVNNVEAVVTPSSMPYVLLGNSFLSRFQMRRENDVMRLDLR
ncbi:MAG: TIGR02281 family clan AA aspartic protease [Rubrivivax sp.]